MIDLQALQYGLVTHGKQTWGLFSNLIKPNVLDRLRAHYPTEGYVRFLRDSGDKKHYSFNLLKLVEHNTFVAENHASIHSQWRELARQFMTKEYADRLGERLQINLHNTLISIGFYRFDHRDWVSPHIDNEDKVVTQIFYFNPYWSHEWGGYFKLLESQDVGSENFAIPPLSSFSVAIARTENAWHMVSPIEKVALSPRLSMQLEFIKK